MAPLSLSAHISLIYTILLGYGLIRPFYTIFLKLGQPGPNITIGSKDNMFRDHQYIGTLK